MSEKISLDSSETNLFIAVECFLIKNKHFIGNQTNNFRIK